VGDREKGVLCRGEGTVGQTVFSPCRNRAQGRVTTPSARATTVILLICICIIVIRNHAIGARPTMGSTGVSPVRLGVPPSRLRDAWHSPNGEFIPSRGPPGGTPAGTGGDACATQAACGGNCIVTVHHHLHPQLPLSFHQKGRTERRPMGMKMMMKMMRMTLGPRLQRDSALDKVVRLRGSPLLSRS
jgi:hypothetical protein